MKKILLVTALLISIYSGKSFAQDIYRYSTNTAGVPDYTDPLLATAGNLTAIGCGTSTACGSGFSGITGFTGTSYSTSGACVEVSLVASAGYTIDATGWGGGLRHSGTGPTDAYLAYSTDGGTTWITDGTDHNPFNGSCATPSLPDTTGAYENVGVIAPAIKFRIYPINASSSGGTFQIMGLHIYGTVIPLCTAPAITSTVTGVTCYGGSDGAVAISTTATATYAWSGPGSFTATTQNISGLTAGIYTVIAASGLCADTTLETVTQPILITAVPTVGSPICPGSAATFSVSSSTSGVAYSWAGPGGFASSLSSFTISPTTPSDLGTYSVTATLGTCSSAPGTTTLAFITPPVATITPAGPTTFCAGGSVVLNGTAGAGYSYKWYRTGSLITGATSAAYTALLGGNYTVVISGAGGCTDSSAATTVTVNPLPTATVTPFGATTFCSGDNVVLNATSGAGYTYQWYNGATLLAGATSASYTASTNGNYLVTVLNTFSCSATSSVTTVSVNPTPAAAITPAGATTFCLGGSVALNATTGTGYTYKWYNTGSLITGAASATYVASTGGDYTVVITGAGPCSDSSAPVTVTINPLPTAAVTPGGPTTFCAGGSVVLTASAGAGYTYQWYNGPSILPGATNISYTATATGTYNVSITNSFGCTAASSYTGVTVNPLPVTTILPGGPTTFCSGGNVALHATPAAGDTYQWYNGATLLPGATTSSYTASANGSYLIQITNAAGCTATTTSPVTVVVNPLPAATITVSGALTFCAGGSAVLTANSGPGYLYQWYNGTTLLTGETGISYTALTTGNYHVVVTNGFGCSATSSATSVTVNPVPVAAITAAGAVTFCSGGSVVLTATAGAGYTYQWSDGSGAIPGETNATYTASVTAGYQVTITGPDGCSATSAPEVVTSVSLPYIIAGGPTSFCAGINTVLSVNVAATGITYQWLRDGVTIPGAVSSGYIAANSGSYSCIVNVSGGSCVSTTTPVTIVVYPAPNPAVTYDGSGFSTADTFLSYQWYVNTMAITGAITNSVTPVNIGSYRVRVVDSNGCTGYSSPLVIDQLGVSVINAADISIYPNPAKNKVYITAPVAVRAVVSGIDGKICISQKNASELDLSQLASGMYIIMLYDDNGERIAIKKLTKE